MEKTLGDRIRKVRKEHKLSQEAFGLKLGVSKTHIYKVEKGKGKMSHTLIMNIAFVFKVRYEWLMDGTGAKYPIDITGMRRVTPLSPYLELPEHILPPGVGPGGIGDLDARKRSDIDRLWPTVLKVGEKTKYIEMVRAILTSDDKATKDALKSNIRVFAERVKERQEIKELKAERLQDRQEMEDLKEKVQRLGKSIALSPDPGKDGADEA